MATQTVEFRSPPSQTITAKLFAIGSDTQVASVSATEATNRKGTYLAAYTDVAAGEYELIALVGAVPVARWFVTLTLTTATFQARDKVGAVELDSSVTDQLDVIQAGVDASLTRTAATLERAPDDTGVITFAWPVTGATITGTVSIDNAAYVPVAGDIAFLRTDAGKHYYTLTHDAADRPTTAGSARYALTDGDYTRYMILRVVKSGDAGEVTALAILCHDWETITGDVPSRSVLNALRHIRNKWALDGNTKTVYAEDDTTPAYTTTITADGAGNITADTPN